MAEVRKYDAFISYRHSELDKFVATTLQRKLEAFSLPKGVTSKTKKKRIERVFRDQDELPLSSNLSEPIHLALNNTDFLIVICTPRLPESKWCEEEISTFIKLYGREKILAVLAEGEPSESFPPLLTGEDYEETLPDGTRVTKHRSFEPLAADVRGKNNKEVRKKLDDAVLRIAASIFELNYDDLKQRHRERRIRRMFSVISSVAAAFMLFSAVCIGLMIKIMNQSNMIMEQNTEIKEQSNEISQKNALINQQYEEAARNLSRLTAADSINLLKKGRKLDALYMLRQVIPDSTSDTSKPYTPEAEAALVDALDVYAPLSELTISNTYVSEYEIKTFSFSPNDTRVLTVDSGNNVKVYDIESGRLLFSEQCESLFSDSNKKAAFCGNDYLVVSESDGIHKYSISDGKDILLDSPKTPGEALEGNVIKANNRNTPYAFLISDMEDVFVLDDTGKSVYSFSLSDYSGSSNLTTLGEYSATNDGKYMAFEIISALDDTVTILAINMETNEIILKETYTTFSINNILFDDHTLYYYVAGTGLSGTDSPKDYNHSCYSFDCDSKKVNWKSDKTDYANKIVVSGNKKLVFLSGYAGITSLDYNTGKIITSDHPSEDITDIFQVGGTDNLFVATQSGNNYILNTSSNTFVRYFSVNTYKENPNLITKTLVLSGDFYVLFENADYITRYKTGKSEYFKEYGKEIDKVSQYNKAENLYICSEGGSSYFVKSTETNETLFSIDNVSDFSFVGDGSQYVVYRSTKEFTLCLYDYVNNKTIALDNIYYKGYSPDKSFVLSKDYEDHYKILELTTMKCTCEFDLPDELDINSSALSLLDENHVLIESPDRDCYEILYIENNEAKKIFTRYTGNLDTLMPCSSQKMFCIAYSTGMVEFFDYSTDKVELINTAFNLEGVGLHTEFDYFPEKEIYVFGGVSKSYIMNKDLCIIASFNQKIHYLPKDNLITYVSVDKTIYAAPFYSYDELVKMADKELTGYCPPIRILKEYDITPN
jgi:hypothetical protein